MLEIGTGKFLKKTKKKWRDVESNTEEKCLKETNKKEKIHERIILKKKEKNPGVSVITEFVKDQVQNSIDDPGVNIDDDDHDGDAVDDEQDKIIGFR